MTQTKRVERFPMLLFKRGSQAMIMTGYQPHSSLVNVMHQFGIAEPEQWLEKPAWCGKHPAKLRSGQ